MPELTTQNHQFRESAIQDMMGKPPGWLLHSGIMAIALVFLIALGLTALIRYPEKVEAPFLLQTETIPLALHAGAMNAIDTVFTQNGAPVTAGDTLLVFRSEADWRPVKALDLWLAAVEQDLYIRSRQPNCRFCGPLTPKGGTKSDNLVGSHTSSGGKPATIPQHLSHLQRLPRLPSPEERGRGQG